MDAEQVRRVRSFNRAVSQRIGALKDHFLDRDRPLGEARLLYEIGRAGAEVRDLRARLELDSGYVSRLLRSLERQRLVRAQAAANDGRVLDELTPPAGVFVVARLGGQPIGCGALKVKDRTTGEVKRMWVAADARGLGVGRRILETLETRARDFGVSTLRLETNRTLKEAQALYRKCGYLEVEPFNDEPYAHHWFEKARI